MADSKQCTISTVTDPESTSAPPGLLESQIRELLHYDTDRANSVFSFLDCYLCMWKYYVVKSAEMIQLEEEHRLLQKVKGFLAGECDTLLQCFSEQALVLQDRTKAMRALQNGVISTLHASDPHPFRIDGP